MPKLTITYDDHTVYDRDVDSYSIEQNASGQVFIVAEQVPPKSIPGVTGTTLDDERFTDEQRAVIARRVSSAPL